MNHPQQPTGQPFAGPGNPFGPGAPGTAPAGKSDKPVTSRTTRIFRISAGAGAVVLVGALFLLNTPDKAHFVVKAKGSISALTTVTAAQLEAVKVDDPQIEAGAITGDSADKAVAVALQMISNRPTQYQIFSGAQMHPEMFSKSEIKLDNALKPDERLFSVQADVSAAAGGTISVGDRVDVVAVSTAGDQIANVIANNVAVVGITASEQQITAAAGQQSGEGKDQKPSDVLPGDPIPGIYVLKIKYKQLSDFAAVAQGAKIYLAYRGAASTSGVSGAVSAQCLITHGVDPTSNEITGNACNPNN